MATIAATIVSGVLSLANKYIADPQERDKFALEMATLQQQSEQAELQADTQVAMAQNEVNKTEAASEDRYIRRWRPTVGYVCAIGFAYQYILQPFLLFIVTYNGKTIDLPNLDMTAIGTVLLGLAGCRSFDKMKK